MVPKARDLGLNKDLEEDSVFDTFPAPPAQEPVCREKNGFLCPIPEGAAVFPWQVMDESLVREAPPRRG